MKEIKYLMKKYFLIILGMYSLRILVTVFFPDLLVRNSGDVDAYTTLFGMYDSYFYNFIVSIFVFWDLKRLNENRIYIAALTTFSMTAGLFFFAILASDKLFDEKYGQG